LLCYIFTFVIPVVFHLFHAADP